MDYIPFSYSQINLSEGTYIPSDFYDNSYSYAYWVRSLFQRACYALKFDNMPFKGADFDFLLYCLFKFGYVIQYNDSEYGNIFQPCTLKGYNIYYQPQSVIITNPYFNSKEIDIAYDNSDIDRGVLLKLTPDYMGIWDIIRYYAKRLASIDPSIDVSIANNKTPFIAYGKNKSAIQTLKKLVDKIHSGVSAIFYDYRVIEDNKGSDPITFIDRPNMKSSYLTTDQLNDQQLLLRAFDREIGIPTIPYEKKERLVSDEATSAIIDSQSRVTIWCECLQSSFDLANNIFGYNMKVTPRYKEEYTNGTSENNDNRDGAMGKQL